MKDRKEDKLWIEYSVEYIVEPGNGFDAGEPGSTFDADIKAAIEKAAKKHGFRCTGSGIDVITGRRDLRFYRHKKCKKRGRRRGRHAITLVPK